MSFQLPDTKNAKCTRICFYWMYIKMYLLVPLSPGASRGEKITQRLVRAMIRARICLREQTDALPSWLLPPTFLSYACSSDTAPYLSYASPNLFQLRHTLLSLDLRGTLFDHRSTCWATLNRIWSTLHHILSRPNPTELCNSLLELTPQRSLIYTALYNTLILCTV